jgi:hypothetical protein
VSSPGTNKNGITVGAASNDRESWLAITPLATPVSAASRDSVAYFSSPGPTDDGRLKPDLLAPGYFVQSARGSNASSRYFCAIQGLSGTSMATPVAAGFGVKVRQYFLQGYYPSGARNDSAGFAPSGKLSTGGINALIVVGYAIRAYSDCERVSICEETSVFDRMCLHGVCVVPGYKRVCVSAAP